MSQPEWAASVPDTAEATPAATVVILRDGPAGLQALMLRRAKAGAFGGMWVFPGGQVEPGDRVEVPTSGESPELATARRAAVREAAEEAGVRLEEHALAALSFWLPPPSAPRRFATWFFLAELPAGQEVRVDQGEILSHRWLAPAEAIELRNGGSLELAPPAFTTLWWLAGHPSARAALSEAASRPPERFETRLGLKDGRPVATLWAGDAAYEDGDLSRPGPRRRLSMEGSGWVVELAP